jgi:hypothetical protein
MKRAVAATVAWTIEIVERSDPQRFVSLPKRRIVEGSSRGPVAIVASPCDFDRHAQTVDAFVRLAIIRITFKRLSRPSRCQ